MAKNMDLNEFLPLPLTPILIEESFEQVKAFKMNHVMISTIGRELFCTCSKFKKKYRRHHPMVLKSKKNHLFTPLARSLPESLGSTA
jgi:hypothetical protein